MEKKKKIIIYLYNRLFDPVIQSNIWLYIKDYLSDEKSSISFHVITYENKSYPLTSEQEKLVEQWKAQGLDWTQLEWNSGISIKAKIKDILSGLRVFCKLRRKGFKHIVAFNSVAGAFSYLFALPLRMRLFIISYEPHSEYATDNKMWEKNSLQYKIAHFLEKKSAQYSTVIASGTKFMKERLENEWNLHDRFIKIPTVISDKKFLYNKEDRIEVRTRLGISPEKWVLYYPGKFGDLYYKEEFAWMYKWLKEEEENLHLLIVTPNKIEDVDLMMMNVGLSADEYTITSSDYKDIQKYSSASDFGIISVPPGPSKKFISNIKVGEYLCSGLPFLITRGVSEDYLYAENKGVGVVVDDFNKKEIKNAWPKIKKFLEMDLCKRRTYCREIGVEYRGFENCNANFKLAIEKLLK